MSSKESVCKIVFVDKNTKSIIFNPKGKVQAIRQATEHLKKLGVNEPSAKQYRDAGIKSVSFNGHHLFRFDRKGEAKTPKKGKPSSREGRRFGGLAKIISIRDQRLHHPKHIMLVEARKLQRVG